MDQDAFTSDEFWSLVDAHIPGWRKEKKYKRFAKFCENLMTKKPGVDLLLPSGQSLLEQYVYPGLDEGGALSVSSNWPLRAGKATLFEGGVRGVSFVAGGYLPDAARGKTRSELMQHVDIPATMARLAGVEWTLVTRPGPERTKGAHAACVSSSSTPKGVSPWSLLSCSRVFPMEPPLLSTSKGVPHASQGCSP